MLIHVYEIVITVKTGFEARRAWIRHPRGGFIPVTVLVPVEILVIEEVYIGTLVLI